MQKVKSLFPHGPHYQQNGKHLKFVFQLQHSNLLYRQICAICNYTSSNQYCTPLLGAEVENCVNGEVRLVEETSDPETVSGVVQLCIAGAWRTACRSEPTFFLWNSHSAHLVCRQLGYSSEGQSSHSEYEDILVLQHHLSRCSQWPQLYH